jgi:GNAT superfamily N-acetyltransferase
MKLIITESQYKKIFNENITYEEEHLGSIYGQDNYELGIYLNGEIVGLVKYVIFDEELTISYIEVRPEFRRQGFGSRMIQYIKKRHPYAKYKPSIKTDLGKVFKHKDISESLIKEDTQLEYDSEFLNDVTVVVVFGNDPLYSQVKGFFDQYGFGFMVPGQNLMIIDGEILVGEPDAKDILKFIEAHEVTHVILGHDGPRNEQDELDADLGAYLLLKDRGYDKSIELLLSHFKERHGVDFDESMLDDIKERM